MRAPTTVTLFLVTALALGAAACKRHGEGGDGGGDDSKLRRIAERLEQAFGRAALPPSREPERLTDRLAAWRDFRACAASVYPARRQAHEQRGVPLPQGSPGLAAVEECAVRGAVADKDPSLCRRLDGEMGPTSGGALRCWDTRARVLGLPDECPVLDLPGGASGRNPECLAAARRDAGLCAFAVDPVRCRAILAGDPAACAGASAPDCKAAATYWSGLVPAGSGSPLVAGPGQATFDVETPDERGDEAERIRLTAPAFATGVSMARDGAMTLAWAGDPSLRAELRPGAPARVTVTWPGSPTHAPRECHGEGGGKLDPFVPQAGAGVTGTLHARLTCGDGSTATLAGDLRLVILDVR